MIKIISAITGFFSALSSIFVLTIAPASIFISVPPTVFECGDSLYAVVWATNAKGTGCVILTDENGNEKCYWDSNSGIIRSEDNVHVVKVSKDELNGKTYRVSSQRMIYRHAYYAVKGKTVTSEAYNFNGIPDNDEINMLCISDIHEMNTELYDSLSYFKDDIDYITLLGDISSELNTKSNFVDRILANSAKISGGEIPVAYVRGNHETRGAYGSQILKYFPSETGEFYYTFDFGPVSAIVIDSGEDKEDNHKEYSGLVDFEEYRKQEYSWLTSLKPEKFKGDYLIAFSHDPEIEDYFGKNWVAPLTELGTDLIVGGHYHKSAFKAGNPPTFYVCGKRSGTDEYAASMLSFAGGKIEMTTINNKGETLLSETITVK